MNINDDLSDLPEIPWPKAGDQLVSEQGHLKFSARVSNVGELFPYIEGYKRAGDAIWSRVEENPRLAGIGYLVFPMVFLYRHFVELSIKQIIALGRYLEGDGFEFPAHHRLKELWDDARVLIERVVTAEATADLDAMGVMVEQLDQIDRESFAFRYPRTKGGKPSVVLIQDLNLEVFRSGIEKMASFFEGCSAQLDAYREQADSMN